MYKGFDKDLKCMGFQYELGKTYEEDSAYLCDCGFHACEDPIDVFGYYPPAGSRYCEVELEGVTDQKDNSDTKRCGLKITIGAEIGIPGIVKAHVEYVKERVKEKVEKGEAEAATAGYRGAATAGSYGAATSRGKSSVGKDGAALARGNNVKAMGGLGAILVLVEEEADSYDIRHWKAVVVDGETIKADTWYTLNDDGDVVEACTGCGNVSL